MSYTVSEVFRIINNKINSVHAMTGRANNSLFTNQVIKDDLKFVLDKYAAYTKILEGIYSTPLNSSKTVISAPTDRIARETYRFIVVFNNGFTYPLNIKDPNYTYGHAPSYTTSTAGIATWIMPWRDNLYIFENTNAPNTTALNGDLTDSATEITVNSTASFPERNGRITIGSEKIVYENQIKSGIFWEIRFSVLF